MAPTVVGTGTVASALAGSITPPFPAGLVAGDTILIVAECEGLTTPGIYTAPTGWAHVTGSPVQQSTNTRLTVLWRRYVAGDVAQTIGNPGDHAIGRTVAFRGGPSAGNPWNVAASSVSSTSSQSCAWPGATTTVPSTLICEIVATGVDTATAQMGTVTNAGYSSITTQVNNWTANGNGGGIGLATGIKATQGATGASTMTLVSASTKAFMTLALCDPAWPVATPILAGVQSTTERTVSQPF